ncbi:hypothetical protein CFRS1_v015273 [Colletotrichum fructicola]|nr:hypothetical protein CFRS1_v015273 [Colletotrichum fructicola]
MYRKVRLRCPATPSNGPTEVQRRPSQKACAIHLAFLDVGPETGAPSSLDEYPGIRAADGMNVDISLAALTTVPVLRECAHDGTGAQRLRLRGGPARIAARATAGLRAVCGPRERPLPQAQEAGNPPERPLPPIPSEKTVPPKKVASSKNAVPPKEAVPSKNIVWHESQVQNSRHFQRFYHDPAKYAARNLLTPADMATAARIAPFYSDLQENELPWPKAWETDAAPLKRKLVHHSWKEALKRNGIDPPPARDGPIDNGPSNGKNGVDKEGGVSEEGLSNSDAGQADVVNPNNGSASGKEGPAVSYADQNRVNSNNARNEDPFDYYLKHNASHTGSAFGKESVASSSAGQNRMVNSIDTQNHNRPDLSLRPQGLLHGADLNRSQQQVGSSKPVSYNSAPTLGPEAENAAGGYSSVGATILAVSNQVPLEPRPRRVDREPAVLGLTELCKEGDRDAQVRRFDRWWKQLTPERRKTILEESKQGGRDGVVSMR